MVEHALGTRDRKGSLCVMRFAVFFARSRSSAAGTTTLAKSNAKRFFCADDFAEAKFARAPDSDAPEEPLCSAESGITPRFTSG